MNKYGTRSQCRPRVGLSSRFIHISQTSKEGGYPSDPGIGAKLDGVSGVVLTRQGKRDLKVIYVPRFRFTSTDPSYHRWAESL